MTEVRLETPELAELSPERRELLDLLLAEGPAEPEVYPLSPQQRGMWLAARMDPESPAYVIALALRLSGRLDRGALRRALAEVVRRHEALRLRFVVIEGEPFQMPEPSVEVTLPLVDLRALPEPARAAEAVRLGEEGGRPFDLERGLKARATLLWTEPGEHRVLFAVHHLVSDAWSMGVLVREVALLYTAFSQGKPSPLPELPVQYLDYVDWQREYLSGDVLAEQLAWWKERLAVAPELDLPTDHRRLAAAAFRGSSRPMEPPPIAMAELHRLCQRHGATPFMVLLAVFETLLHRYSGQDDFAVGTAVANRRLRELEDLIGLFVNTLALRADLRGDPPFQDLLARVKAEMVNAYAHQDLPFERLVAELGIRRDPGRSPLFQTFFQVQNAPLSDLELPGLSLSGAEREKETAEFDLVVSLRDTPDAIFGDWTFRTDLFESATVARMARHFGILLAGVVADENRRLSDLPLLTAGERHQLVGEWNVPARAAGPRRCLHERFESIAASMPEAVAVVCGGEPLRYGELNRRANRLAHRLLRLGAGPGTRVALFFERSLDLVVAVLGTLKAGAAYVPLDPAYPAERLGFALADSQAPVVVTQSRLMEALPEHGARTLLLDADPLAEESDENPGAGISAADPAYVIYTSGSTGRPKGVVVRHAEVDRLFLATDEWFCFGPPDVWTLFHSYAFDFSVWELWGALLYGGRLVVVPFDVSRSPQRFHDLLARERVTVLNQTPSAFRQLMEADATQNSDQLALRLVIFGGEALDPGSLAPWFARHGDGSPRLVNMYGITETTVHVTYRPLRRGDLERGRSLIGRAIPDLSLSVLDRDGRPVPVGVPGELCIGGDGLALGYLNRPDLTANRFVPDPLADEPGGRLYRSGDLARYLPYGDLEYLGRIDRQVKIRGFRIELGEIEAALRGHPGVRQAVVIVRDEGTDDRRLAAYFVGEAREEELRSHLRGLLPDYMVPASFARLETLPLTPNGKLDVRALPDPLRPASAAGYILPRDPVEEELAAIWARLLKIERVGVHDNFFELGGHSLMGTRVLAAVRETFGVDVPLPTLFEKPTVAELALALAESRTLTEAPSDRIPHLPRDTNRFPVSASQLREWLLDRLLPGAGAYNIPGATRVVGALEIRVLELSLAEIVRRHETLRTTFVEGESEPVQVIAPDLALAVPLADLSGLPAEVREREVRRVSHEELREPFDLARGPLLRVRLLRLAEREHLVLFTIHHIVSDGWSMGVFFRELATLYLAFSQGRPSPLPELTVQYADFAVWQRRRLEGGGLGELLDYWRRQLAGVPALEMATDRPRPPVQRFEGAKQPFSLTPELSADLKNLAQRRGVSLFMALLAGFAALLARYSGQEDFAVGTFAGNRNRAELEGLIGFFINSLVLRLRPEGEASFGRLLEQAREVTLGAFAHQDVPFERLLEALHVERDFSRTPLFQVMLVFQNFPTSAIEVSDVRLEPVAVSSDHSDFDLSLWLSESAEGVDGYFSYGVHVFDRSTIVRLSTHLQVLLRGAVGNPEMPLRDLPLLTEPERRELLEWSAGPPGEPAARRVEALFTERARLSPEATALEWDGGRFTYAELDRRSDALADRLRELGVGPEVLVGLAMARSPEMIVALLAVLKAGGAYLPLDPAYPEARRAFMIEDAGVVAMLTSKDLKDSTERRDEESPSLDSAQEANPAYVIYTSGSTGKPKGVVVEHRSLAAYTVGAMAAFELTPEDRVLQFASISFDTSGEEIYPALASGAALVLRPGDMAASIAHFLREVERLRITVLDLPTAFWHELVAGLGTEGNLPACVRLVILGGEKVLPERVAQWRASVGSGVRLLNTYGPTEATIVSTRRDLTRGPDEAPIGRPIPGAAVHVLDRWGGPVPVGAAGELHIGGFGLARGYLRRPEITAERFVPNPFGSMGERLYRTGDRVRWRPSGDLEFLGRVDQQIKLRGFRVEPGEIESALRSHPAVRDAVVVLKPGPGGDPRLVAYTVRETAEGGTDLRAFLKERLPEFMVPALFMELPALPLTPSGKVDRRALPEPDGDRPELPAAYEAPRSELERTIAGIWRELLGVERIGLHDNFFDLGAHSLLIVRAHARLRETLGRELTVVDLFRHSSVGALARHLSQGEEKPSFQEVKTLAQQQKAALGRQRQAMERLRKRTPKE
ncbi:MAG TPA: amino acid adenylation domain-containing protein [Thermoanaerobaculia bacterium]|jgi:amino acid adenylation domain-containing protein|nr:amino acid adenylation domain-containing protein [Thermoanaerobaculia bacterium]